MADPAPKGDEGKIACQETKGHAQAYGVVLWGTRVISVNGWIVRTLTSRRCKWTPIGKTPGTGADPYGRVQRSSAVILWGAGAMLDQGIRGGEWGTYVTLDTYSTDERGIV